MSLNPRALRVRLCLWYVLLSMAWMSALGIFSYIYLSHALASSREQTMQRRETRMIRFIKEEPFLAPGTPLAVQLHHFMLVSPDTDLLEVSKLDGTPIYMSPNGGGRIPWTGDGCKDPCFNIVHLDSHTFRTLQHVVDLEGYPVRLTMAGVMDEHYDILKMVETSYLIFLPLMLLAAIAGGFMLSHRALEPVDRITRAARTLGIHDLHRRLPIGATGDELQRLAEAWNELLERLERAVKGLTQLTSDVSHDLRTTITVMLATTQLALSRPRSNQEYRDSLQTIMEECQSTAALLDDLLAAARADTPEQQIERRPLDLGEIIHEVCDHLLARTEMKHQQLTVELEQEIWILGAASLIRRLVSILLDNAIKYTGEYGSIAIEVRTAGNTHILEVRDTGVGIPQEEMPRIFDRFYRVDTSRNRAEGGNGLGLAIAKWITQVHDATIHVQPGRASGTVFQVRFQAIPAPAALEVV